jgi:ABC-2 type transport system ATP-binding protein
VYDSASPAISIRALTKRYKKGALANDAIDLDVPAGSIYGLLGPNGAGKTTLVRQLTGELLPTSGEITVAGVDVVRNPMAAKWLMGIVPQEAGTFEVVTTEDHLKLFGRLRGLGIGAARARAEQLMQQLDLLPHRDKQSRHLSGGLRRKLLVGMALVADPRVLVLDEPTTGLDPRSRREVWDLITSVRSTGATVLLTTHYMEEAEALCNQVAIIGEGRVLARGTAVQLMRSAPFAATSSRPPIRTTATAVSSTAGRSPRSSHALNRSASSSTPSARAASKTSTSS